MKPKYSDIDARLDGIYDRLADIDRRFGELQDQELWRRRPIPTLISGNGRMRVDVSPAGGLVPLTWDEEVVPIPPGWKLVRE